MNRIFLVITSAIILLSSCDTKPSKTEEKAPETVTETDNVSAPLNALQQEYSSLKADVDESWGYLDKIEEDKYFAMERLLQEVSYNPRHKASRLQEEQEKINALKEIKPTPSLLKDLNELDAYDLQSNATLSSLNAFVSDTKNMEQYPLAEDLLNELDSLNNGATISYRGLYGEAVLNYNKFIRENKEELEAQGIKDLEPIPGFFTE